MKEPLEFFVATIGWVLFVFAMVGFLHLAAMMDSTALQKQDAKPYVCTHMKAERGECLPVMRLNMGPE